MYGLIIYNGRYYDNGRFLELLFGHKHKKAIRISIDFKKEQISKVDFYPNKIEPGLKILDKVLSHWDLKLSKKVKRYIYAIKKSLT